MVKDKFKDRVKLPKQVLNILLVIDKPKVRVIPKPPLLKITLLLVNKDTILDNKETTLIPRLMRVPPEDTDNFNIYYIF